MKPAVKLACWIGAFLALSLAQLGLFFVRGAVGNKIWALL